MLPRISYFCAFGTQHTRTHQPSGVPLSLKPHNVSVRTQVGKGEEGGNSVPLTGLPQIQGGRLRRALRRSPAGAPQQPPQQQRRQQQLQDAPAPARSAPIPGRRQPHAAGSRSRVQGRDSEVGGPGVLSLPWEGLPEE